ncbi:MAG: DUF1176 domain-containing protein [Phyllobacteriaceae bacterium]|nr:DUF1176 domain-containing protein [Phyllobacteriaceae bacterium]
MRLACRAGAGASLAIFLCLPAIAEPVLRFAEHAGEIVDGPALKSEPLPDGGTRCVDICRETAGCVATRLDGDQCLLLSAVSGLRADPTGVAMSWVGARVELSELRRDRMGEIAYLHGDFLYRADTQWLTLPDADGMAEDVLPGALDALAAGDFAMAESGLAAAFSLGQDRSAVWRVGAQRLIGKLAMDPPESRVAAAGLREFAIAAATNAYLTALDLHERLAALATLGDGLAEAGDFIAAAAVGRYRLSLKEDGAFQASVEHWEDEAKANAPASEGEGPRTAEFGVWKVACDNANSCVATAFAEGEHEGRLRIDYFRDAGPVGAAHVMLMAQPFDENQQLGLPHESLFFDGTMPAEAVSATLEPLSWSHSPGLSTLTVPAASAPEVLGLIAASDEMGLRAAPGEPILGTLALAGFRQAVDFIDGVQGRAGGETALNEPAGQKPAAVPQPPKLPVVDPEPVDGGEVAGEPPVAVVEAWKAACDEHDFVMESGGHGAKGHSLDAARQIWLLGCSRGAYNFASMAFLFEAGKATQLMFERPEGDGAVADDPEVWLPEVQRSLDAVTMAEPEGEAGARPFVLRSYNRGRGIGDCGVSARHVWEAGGFRLYDQSRMDWCQGWRDFWPMTYRASAFPDRSDESAHEAGAD